MKRKGSKSDFAPDRDRELMAAFRDVLAMERGTPLRDMFGMAASRPCSRFWVSEERAETVIGEMLRTGVPERVLAGMIDTRRQMYLDLWQRVEKILSDAPGMCLRHAVSEAIAQPAPCFYLTPESARSIIYRARRRAKMLRAASTLLRSKIIARKEENYE